MPYIVSIYTKIYEDPEPLYVSSYDEFILPVFQLTWADLAVMNAWHWIPGFGVLPRLHEYPKLQAHSEKIQAHPGVAEWLETRPETPV